MKGQQTCKLQISAAFIIYLQSDCKSPFPNLTPEIVWIKMIWNKILHNIFFILRKIFSAICRSLSGAWPEAFLGFTPPDDDDQQTKQVDVRNKEQKTRNAGELSVI